jgi:hypothetical protein
VLSPIVDVLAENDQVLAKRLLKPLLRLINASRETCGGDADKFMILLSVAIRTAEHPDFATLKLEQIDSGTVAWLPSLALNIRSIADSMSMPRETTRRKVSELVSAGWLVRNNASIQMTTQGYRELAPVWQGLKVLAASYWQLVSELLPDGPKAEASRRVSAH